MTPRQVQKYAERIYRMSVEADDRAARTASAPPASRTRRPLAELLEQPSAPRRRAPQLLALGNGLPAVQGPVRPALANRQLSISNDRQRSRSPRGYRQRGAGGNLFGGIQIFIKTLTGHYYYNLFLLTYSY